MLSTYKAGTDLLTDRIVALGPRILDIRDVFELAGIPEFRYADIQPTLAQMTQAFIIARGLVRR